MYAVFNHFAKIAEQHCERVKEVFRVISFIRKNLAQSEIFHKTSIYFSQFNTSIHFAQEKY
jgi:hypothetical protein